MARRTSGRLRKAKQKLRARYSREREDRQLAGEEPTMPDGAVHDERVDPSMQSSQQFPHLVMAAIRQGWDVPDEAKRRAIAETLAVIHDPDCDPMLRVRLARTLLLADQTQWERDHVEEAGKAKGGGSATAVSVQANIQAAALIREMIESATDQGAVSQWTLW